MTPLVRRLTRCLSTANRAFQCGNKMPRELAHTNTQACRLAWQWFVFEMLHGEEAGVPVSPAILAQAFGVQERTILRARSDERIRRTLFPWPSQIHNSLSAQRSGLLGDNPPAWEDDVSPMSSPERSGRREVMA